MSHAFRRIDAQRKKLKLNQKQWCAYIGRSETLDTLWKQGKRRVSSIDEQVANEVFCILWAAHERLQSR